MPSVRAFLVVNKLARVGAVVGSSPPVQDLKAGRLPGRKLEVTLETDAPVADIERLLGQISDLDKEITGAVKAHQAAARLTGLPGCAALTAAKIVGETARIDRFTDEAKYAMHAGVAPIPVWSGRTRGKVRVARIGNRQLNTALHRIAITQLRCHAPAQAYYAKRLAAGDTRTEAIRRLKRRLARVVYQILKNTTSTPAKTLLPAAA